MFEALVKTRRGPSVASLTAVVRSVALLVPIGATLAVLTRPPGALVQDAREWRALNRIERGARRHWPELVGPYVSDKQAASARAIVVFTDYECDACRTAHDTLQAFERSHPEIKIVVRHLPTSSHLMAEQAARAAICAEQQGNFERLHAGLMQSDTWLDGPTWVVEARRAGVQDTLSFLSCLSDPETADRIHSDRGLAVAVGIRATPSYLTPKGVVVGIPTVRALEKLLR